MRPALGARQVDLRYYLRVIFKRKWLILSFAVIFTTMAALYATRLPTFYEATSTIRIEQPSNDLLEGAGAHYSYRSPEYWNTQLLTLQSPQLMRQIALKLDLPRNPAFLERPKSKGLLTSVRQIFSKAQPRPSPPASDAGVPVAEESALDMKPDAESLSVEQLSRLGPYVSALLGGLSVEQVKGTNLIRITYRHGDPAIAVQVSNALAQVFIENEFRRETAATNRATLKLNREIADLQTAIKEQEQQRVEEMKSKNLPLGQAKGQNLTTARLGTLSDQLLAAEDERKKLQSAYEQAAKAADIWSVPEVNQSSDVQEGRKELRRLERERAQMLERYTESWPKIKELDSQIREVREKVDTAAREAVSVLKSRYDSSLEREKKLRSAYETERGAANQQSQAETMMNSVNQQITINKELYSTLVQRQKELEIISNGRASNITVSSPAVLPETPIPQNRTRFVVIGGMFSLVFGATLAYMLHMLDNTLKDVDDVAVYTQLPTLALIPQGPGSSRAGLLTRRGATPGERFVALTLTRDLRSPTAEAYRHLRTSLLLTSTGSPPKCILVTSGQAGEGKTTTAISTAITFAQESAGVQEGPDVLLIDCDLRRPRIHKHFELPNAQGLTNYLSGHAEMDTLLHSYSELPNLKIMTAGPMPANPADFLGSFEMLNLLDEARARFKYVIIDSPPASSFADAALLSTQVDGVVLVVHSKHSSRVMAQRVKERLRSVGAHIYGVVLNCSELESDEYYAGYYTSYYADDEPPGEPATRRPSG